MTNGASKQVIFLIDRWQSTAGGIQTVNRELACAIAEQQQGIGCLVLVPFATDEERADASRRGVTLVAGDSEFDWTSTLASPKLGGTASTEVLAVVGHSYFSGDHAIQLRDRLFPRALSIQFIHMNPLHTESLKEYRQDSYVAERERRYRTEIEIAQRADIVVCIGPRLWSSYLDYLVAKRAKQQVVRIDCGIERSSVVRLAPVQASLLCLGRADSLNVKGLDLFAYTAGHLTRIWPRYQGMRPRSAPKFVVRGAKENPEQLERKLCTLSEEAGARAPIIVRPYTSDSKELKSDYLSASIFLMPSREEGFGLVACEALSLGVPILISSESGLADKLSEIAADTSTSKHECIVRHSGSDLEIGLAYARAAMKFLLDEDAASIYTENLRDALWQTCSWSEAAKRFLDVLHPVSVGARLENALVRDSADRFSPLGARTRKLISGRRGRPRVSLSRMPVTDYALFGRSERLTELDEAWKRGTNVAQVIAWTGVGKTSLINVFLSRLQERSYDDAEWVRAWSFDKEFFEASGGTADLLIESFLTEFGDPHPSSGSPWDRGSRLAALVCETKSLIVLDALEPLQYPPGHPQAGSIAGQALQSFVRGLARYNRGLLIITSRIHVRDLDSVPPPLSAVIDLERLSEEDGQQYLRYLKVGGDSQQRRLISREYEGHALSLTLVGRYIALLHNGDPAGAADIRNSPKLPNLENERIWSVISSYEEWFRGKVEHELLLLLAISRGVLNPAVLKILITGETIEGFTTLCKTTSSAELKRVIYTLRSCDIISPQNPARPKDLECHPLVTHYFQKAARENDDAWRQLNKKLFDYYANKQSTGSSYIEQIQPWVAAVIHGCYAGQADVAFETVYLMKMWSGSLRAPDQGAPGQHLMALASFFKVQWTELIEEVSTTIKPAILNLVGYYLCALGSILDAVEPTELALELWEMEGEHTHAAKAAGNLSELSLALGRIDDAIRFATSGVDHADNGTLPEQRVEQRTTLADATHQAGDLDLAKEIFEEAESLQARINPSKPIMTDIWAYRYHSLLLGMGKETTVRRRAVQQLRIPGTRTALLDSALGLLALGQAHTALAENSGDISRLHLAEKYLTRALAKLLQVGTQNYVPWALLARSSAYRLLDRLSSALEDVDEALAVCARGSMRLLAVDALIEKARIHLEQGNIAEAASIVDHVGEEIVELRYKRRAEDLEDLRQRVQQLK